MEPASPTGQMIAGGLFAAACGGAITYLFHRAFPDKGGVVWSVGIPSTLTFTVITPLAINSALADETEQGEATEDFVARLLISDRASADVACMEAGDRIQIWQYLAHMPDQTKPKAIGSAYFAEHEDQVNEVAEGLLDQAPVLVEVTYPRFASWLASEPLKEVIAIFDEKNQLRDGPRGRVKRQLIPLLGGDAAVDEATRRGGKLLLEDVINTCAGEVSNGKLEELWKNPEVRDLILRCLPNDEARRPFFEKALAELPNDDFCKLLDCIPTSATVLQGVANAQLDARGDLWELLKTHGLIAVLHYHPNYKELTNERMFELVLGHRTVVAQAASSWLEQHQSPVKRHVRRKEEAVPLLIARRREISECASDWLSSQGISIDARIQSEADPLRRAVLLALSSDTQDEALKWIREKGPIIYRRIKLPVGDEALLGLIQRAAKEVGLTDGDYLDPEPGDREFIKLLK